MVDLEYFFIGIGRVYGADLAYLLMTLAFLTAALNNG
jgi:hypothetical protein